MAQTAVTPITPFVINSGTPTAGALDIAFTACDAVNGNKVGSTGRELLIFKNSDTVAHTITINSVADDAGRTQDVTNYSIAAGTVSVFGPVPQYGWKQGSDGSIHFQANSALVLVAVLQLPSIN